ncbi:MAG: hypothetical protein ABJQ70_19145 [Roseobacter sp.]
MKKTDDVTIRFGVGDFDFWRSDLMCFRGSIVVLISADKES